MNLPIKDFDQILKEGIEKCPADKHYVVLHVFSGQMAIWCEYYDTTSEIAKVVARGIIDPQGWVDVKAIYDNVDKELVYYNAIGFDGDVHEQWEIEKDIPNPEPIPATPFVENPREKKDHYCQYDPDEDICYFCGEKKKV